MRRDGLGSICREGGSGIANLQRRQIRSGPHGPSQSSRGDYLVTSRFQNLVTTVEVKGIEPLTLGLQSRCSPAELNPRLELSSIRCVTRMSIHRSVRSHW